MGGVGEVLARGEHVVGFEAACQRYSELTRRTPGDLRYSSLLG